VNRRSSAELMGGSRVHIDEFVDDALAGEAMEATS
jgi:hypothetical protein